MIAGEVLGARTPQMAASEHAREQVAEPQLRGFARQNAPAASLLRAESRMAERTEFRAEARSVLIVSRSAAFGSLFPFVVNLHCPAAIAER